MRIPDFASSCIWLWCDPQRPQDILKFTWENEQCVINTHELASICTSCMQGHLQIPLKSIYWLRVDNVWMDSLWIMHAKACVFMYISRSCMWFGIAVFWTQLARTSVAMSRDSGVTSLPSAGWSCASLEQGVQMAAEAAGLDLRTRDFSQAGFSQIILYTNRVRMDPQICATWNVLHFQTL